MRVLVLPGDGIGAEVTSAALEVVHALGLPWELTVRDDVTSAAWIATGVGIPDELMTQLRSGHFDAILFGAVGDPAAPDGAVERAVVLRLRAELDLAVNVRPLRLPAHFPSPLTSGARLDAVVVRENTEGAYSGLGGRMRSGTPQELAISVSVSTRAGVERALRHAFTLAQQRARRVTLVHKANVLGAEGSLWKEVAQSIAAASDVEYSYEHADAASMRLVTDPGRYDVIVTDNLFGDLLTDLGAALSGGIGLAPSANINVDSGLALFEPIHGSAPDIAGTGRANPIAMIRCVALCAAHLGDRAAADAIEAAIDRTARADEQRSTREIADAIAAELRREDRA